MTSHAYWFGGEVISSAIALPLVHAVGLASSSADLTVEHVPVVPDIDFSDLVTDGFMNGLAWRFGRTADGAWAHVYGGLVACMIEDDGTRVHVLALNGVPDDVVSEIVITWALVYRRIAGGGWCFHGSAVEAPDGRAISFLGPSGSGKSTLVAAAVAAGGRLLADDSLMGRAEPDGVWIDNTAADLKLRDQARSIAAQVSHHGERITFDDRLAVSVAANSTSARLGLTVFIGPRSSRTEIDELAPTDTFGRLLRNSKVGLWTNPDARDAEFDAAQSIASTTRSVELRMPSLAHGDDGILERTVGRLLHG